MKDLEPPSGGSEAVLPVRMDPDRFGCCRFISMRYDRRAASRLFYHAPRPPGPGEFCAFCRTLARSM
jgi:hypothetical protein